MVSIMLPILHRYGRHRGHLTATSRWIIPDALSSIMSWISSSSHLAFAILAGARFELLLGGGDLSGVKEGVSGLRVDEDDGEGLWFSEAGREMIGSDCWAFRSRSTLPSSSTSGVRSRQRRLWMQW